MNKTEIIKTVNNRIKGQTNQSITEVIDTLFDVIAEELKENRTINFQGFISIENKLIKGRSGVFNDVAWQTQDKLSPRIKVMNKFKKEIENANK